LLLPETPFIALRIEAPELAAEIVLSFAGKH
jgi:hypothetical protein